MLLRFIDVNRKKLIILLSGFTYLALLALILVSRDPICIKSSIVNKLDIKFKKQTQTVYSCSSKLKAIYAPLLEEEVNRLNISLAKIEQFLSGIAKTKGRLNLIYDRQNPLKYEFKENTLFIGEILLHEDTFLHRSIIKFWLRGHIKDELLQHSLFEESMVDMVYFAFKGDLDIIDPISLKSANLNERNMNYRWPQVLKSFDDYCESPWKMLEHFENCSFLSKQKNIDSVSQFIEMSVRPLTTQTLISAYKQLNFFEKNSFILNLPKRLSKLQISSDKAIDFILTDKNPIQKGLHAIRLFAGIFSQSEFLKTVDFKKFVAQISTHLENSGVTDSFAEAYVDYLVEIPERLDPESMFFKTLNLAAEKDPGTLYAVTDRKDIWLLPFGSRLPVKTFDRVFARQILFFACPSLKSIAVEDYFEKATKLLIVKGCDQETDYQFSQLKKDGIQDFLRKNQRFSFVQFHLPSLELKQKELQHIKNYFELVKNKKIEQSEFKILGWTQIQWSDAIHAYKPKAAVNAIESFRIITSDL